MTEDFLRLFGARPEVRVRAPGRVNLLGEHTDYTGGLVLPMAIDKYVGVEVSRRGDGRVCVEAPRVRGSVELSAADARRRVPERWVNYVLGAAAEIPNGGGFNLLLGGDLPMGAGLASSAAVTVASTYALAKLFGVSMTDRELILAAQRAEHRFAGVMCGVMDPAACAASRRGHALFINCRTLEMRPIPFADESVVVAVFHTGVKHALAESAYNTRVAECREARERVGRELCELRPGDLAGLKQLPAGLFARVEHVVRENERVRAACGALESGDIESFGRLMFESHESLRDRYEVSCRELDVLVESARARGAVGAKMTGAGFGGAVVCLVPAGVMGEFSEGIAHDYRKAAGREVEISICRSADGARVN